MPSRILWTAAALPLALACAGGERADQPAEQPSVSAVDVAGVGLAAPEGTIHDTAADVYLVSNINGQPTDKDDNGFITRFAPTGEVLTLKWIDGASDAVTLHAPKGMAIRHDTLFVADIDDVRLFDRVSGAALAAWPVAGATFLNDLAVGPDGTLYVTDSGLSPAEDGLAGNGGDAVYRRTHDGWAPVAQSPDLGGPNGVIADTTGITVVTFLSGEVYRLNASTGQRVMLPKPEQGGLDGIVKLADGTLLISSWADKGVYRLSTAGGFSRALPDTVDSPADISFDAKRHVLLIPDMTHDRVLIRPLD